MASTFDRGTLWQVQRVPLTVFDSSCKLSRDPMRQNTQRLLEAGGRVFVPCAGSSEFPTLTADDRHLSSGEKREIDEIIAPILEAEKAMAESVTA